MYLSEQHRTYNTKGEPLCKLWTLGGDPSGDTALRHTCRFISYNKCSALVGDVDERGAHPCLGTRSRWEIASRSPHFWFEPKTALKIV